MLRCFNLFFMVVQGRKGDAWPCLGGLVGLRAAPMHMPLTIHEDEGREGGARPTCVAPLRYMWIKVRRVACAPRGSGCECRPVRCM